MRGGTGPRAAGGIAALWRRVLDRLSRRFVVLMIVVGCVLAAAHVKFMSDMSDAALTHLMAEDTGAAAQAKAGLKIASAFQGRLIVFLVLTSSCLGLVGHIICARFLCPLRVLAKGAEDVAEGNLDVAFPSEGPEDVARLGDALNQIAVNYQEVLLLTGTTVGKLKEIAGKLDQAAQEGPYVSSSPPISALISEMDANLDTLVDIVQSFEYFQTSFDGAKVVGDPPTKR